MRNLSMTTRPTTLALFNYDWDQIALSRLATTWPHHHAGFDLFSFPSNARLAWFDMDRFVALWAWRARRLGLRAVVSNHEQFGALAAALLAERMGWPGTPVKAVLACQHKLYAREVLQHVCPRGQPPAIHARLDCANMADSVPYATCELSGVCETGQGGVFSAGAHRTKPGRTAPPHPLRRLGAVGHPPSGRALRAASCRRAPAGGRHGAQPDGRSARQRSRSTAWTAMCFRAPCADWAWSMWPCTRARRHSCASITRAACPRR
jgi:hypothetical protein